MLACREMMGGASTSVRVSHETLRELERLRRAFQVQTAEETIRELIRERKFRSLARLFGSGKGVVAPFTEDDRLDSHY